MEGDQGIPGDVGPTGKQVLLDCIVYHTHAISAPSILWW